MTLGEFVRQRRLRLGLEQNEVADRMGNRQANWVSQLENGKISRLPDADTLDRLADALESSQRDLIAAAGYQLSDDDDAPDEEQWEVSDLESVARQLRSLLVRIESQK